MSRRLVFHPYAQIELAEAIGWYEDRRIGLGAELLTAAEAAFAEVVEAPHTWPLVRAGKEQRRYLLKRFPYLVAYVFNQAEVRAAEPPERGEVFELPLVGGLHHRYSRRAA